jgi:hypothetical protein
MASGPFAEQPRLPFPLQEGERVIQLCRRHWWYLWPRTILWAALALVPVIIAAWAFAAPGWLDNVGIVFWPVAGIWLLFWTFRLLLNWYQYTRDIWVITDQRIVDSMQPTPFRHHLSTADLVNIQDISVEKSGVIPSLLNFGDVILETAGASKGFRIAGVPRPTDVQLLIDKERDRERGR